MLVLEPIEATSEMNIRSEEFPQVDLRLWLPEAILTPRGCAGCYPRGMPWEETPRGWAQVAEESHAFGPGNVVEVEPGILECCGLQQDKEPELAWNSEYYHEGNRVDFLITLSNNSDREFDHLAAAVCLLFRNASWWNDEQAYLWTADGPTSVAELGRVSSPRNGYQAWLLEGREFPNPFMAQFWSYHPERITRPLWVVDHPAAGCRIVFSATEAYYLHSNLGNPCTDAALMFGSLKPGQLVSQTGSVAVTKAGLEEIFSLAETDRYAFWKQEL
jgi:hypothetical protein